FDPFLPTLLVFVTGGMESSIFGGKEAKHHSRPYMVSIQCKNHHTCGGMLIRQDYVLTAAHCLSLVDSGSHLICYTKPQGIASYTIKNNCTNTTYPQVYVKISYFLPWTKKKIKMND
uniref:Granzyme B-like n=1 Tax=Sinocyclocheilus anshuiensis TaxID=1608454 RepID=A0A671NHC9_9TELE